MYNMTMQASRESSSDMLMMSSEKGRSQTVSREIPEEVIITETQEDGAILFICRFCDRGFKRRAFLKNHILSRHDKQGLKRSCEEETEAKKKRKGEEEREESDLDENVNNDELVEHDLNMTNDEFVVGFMAEGKGIPTDDNFDETSIAVHSTVIEDDLEDEFPPNQEHYQKQRYN